MGREDKEGQKRAAALIARVERDTEPHLDALAKELEASLADDAAAVRHAALDALGRLSEFRGLKLDARVSSRVAALANDPDARVRAEVAVALVLLPATGSERGTLDRLLEDPSPIVRQEAAAALGDHGDPEAVDILAAHLTDESSDVCFEAAFALASLRDSRGLEVLVDALDTNLRRLDACEALRRLGDRRATPALQRTLGRFFLGWPDRLTILATLHALGDSTAAEGLIARARSRNREERAYALSLLGQQRVKDGGSVLSETATNARDPLRDTAVRALGDLGDRAWSNVLYEIALDDASPLELRADALTALDKVEVAVKLRAFEALRNHPDPKVSALAAEGDQR